ncbi:unnamed protein product [Diabrotica balteata]|uniref:HTH CENPB-type domain-containing protein n=1 Tax=Diabrotica balteata TaxID=107213 RepID=A0A9N9XG97_DIABA|nr:unnamed protein product [Diabrotica balteata]
MLQAKAVEFHKRFKDGEENFTASVGWLDRWQLNISGKKVSADSSEIEPFNLKLRDLILEHGLTSDQIFNCDETGLNFRMLPTKKLATQSKQMRVDAKNE